MDFFHRGFTQIMQFSLWLLQTENLPTRTSCSDTKVYVLRAAEKFIKLNIDTFCIFKNKQSGRLQLSLHSHKLAYILLSCAIFGSGLLPGCQLFLYTNCSIYDSLNFQASIIQPILLLSLECEKLLFRLRSCLASLAVHYHPNNHGSSRPKAQDRKLQKKGRISLVFMSLEVLQLHLWIPSHCYQWPREL